MVVIILDSTWLNLGIFALWNAQKCVSQGSEKSPFISGGHFPLFVVPGDWQVFLCFFLCLRLFPQECVSQGSTDLVAGARDRHPHGCKLLNSAELLMAVARNGRWKRLGVQIARNL